MTYVPGYSEAERFKKDIDCLWHGGNPGHVIVEYTVDGGPIDHVSYHRDKKRMYEVQMKTIELSLKERCPFIPSLWPDLGVVAVATGFGSKATFIPHDWPAVTEFAISDIREAAKLSRPDCRRDGLMPYVLECLEYFKTKVRGDIPIGICDVQAPAEVAFQVCRYQDFLTGVLLHPDSAKKLIGLCLETILEFVKVQKNLIGQEMDEFYGFGKYYIPRGCGGIYATQDFAAMVSPETYREYGVPFASVLFEATGGGIVHNCGHCEHQLDNFGMLPKVRCLEIAQGVVDVNDIYAKTKDRFFFTSTIPCDDRIEERLEYMLDKCRGIPCWLKTSVPREKLERVRRLVNRISE